MIWKKTFKNLHIFVYFWASTLFAALAAKIDRYRTAADEHNNQTDDNDDS